MISNFFFQYLKSFLEYEASQGELLNISLGNMMEICDFKMMGE
jgi:hypothetical protein